MNPRHCLLIAFFLCSAATWADTPFEVAFSSQSAPGFMKKSATLHFLDSDSHVPLHSVPLGVMSSGYQVSAQADNDGRYLYVSVPGKASDTWELLVFSLQDQVEVARIPIGRRIPDSKKYNTQLVQLSADRKRLAVLALSKRKKWRLETYSVPGFELLGSIDLPKGVASGNQLDNGNMAITTSHTSGGDERVLLVDLNKHEVIAEYEYPRRSEVRLLPSENPDHVLVLSSDKQEIARDPSTLKMIEARVVDLTTLDARTGERLMTQKLGLNPTLLNVSPNNQAAYFATRKSHRGTGLTLWKLEDGAVSPLIETTIHFDPTATFVDEAKDMAIVLCGEKAVVMRLSDRSIVHEKVRLPIEAVSGLLNKDASRLYFREEIGSEVGVLDIASGHVLEDAPTGRRGMKLAQAAATATGVLVGWYTGFYVLLLPADTETSMVLGPDEQDLYVLNHKTSDVTVLGGPELKREGTVAVGSAVAVRRYEQSPYIYALGPYQITVIDPKTKDELVEYDDGQWVGEDVQRGRLFFAHKKRGLQVISVRTAKLEKSVSSLDGVFLVITDRGPS